MKNSLRLLPRLLCLAAAAALSRGADQPAPPAPEGGPDSALHLKFSDPAKPGTVRLKLMMGDVTVTGADTTEVTVVSNIKTKRPAEHRPDGLRRLDSEVTYSAAEKDNVITLEFSGDLPGPQAANANVNITVPRQTSVIVSNSFGGNITVKDVAGQVEVHNMNGEIMLDQISGAATVETMNGEVHAAFAKVAGDKPLSFTSMNGEIEVRVPADTKANVRLRTQNGAIYTDFDEKALITKTEAAHGRMSHVSVRTTGHGSDWHNDIREAVRTGVEALHEAVEAAREGAEEAGKPIPSIRIPPIPVLPALSGGKLVSGTLNGGGSEIQIATMNGTITLRKAQP